MTGSLETLFITSAAGTNGPLRECTQWTTDIVNGFGALLPPAMQTTSMVIVGLTGATLLGAAAFIKMRSGLGRTVEALKQVTFQVRYTPVGTPPSFGGGFLEGNRWGGVYEHAQAGLLREAGIFSARTPARYAFAEPATGGEAFIPKHGDTARSLAILSRAADWHDATVVPRGAWYGTGGGVATGAASTVTNTGDMNVHITVPLEDLRQLPDLEQFLDNMRNNSRRGITSLQSNDRTMDRWTLG